uniref:Large ribosomal subunit protein bL20c n=1 Tax=Halochlorococcum sp. NIES-1838 TaxID=2249730 RepID=A0A2Z4MA56_9CHLO|nr:ribosomal protein L20 [Halochlorococcum sp. NIES-1838]
MTRVKRGFVARKRRKKVLNLTKGFRGSGSILFRSANQRKMKALVFAYRDRRRKKRDLRGLWITRINSAARLYDLNYSQLIYKLKQLNIIINRKWLAQLAVRDTQIFQQLIKKVLV